MFKSVMASFQTALRHWLPFLSVHLFVRLVVAAVILPLTGGLLTFALSFSDQPAVTDQDIARFLLTPVGALGAISVISMLIVAAVVDIAAMTTILRAKTFRPLEALETALGFLVEAFPRLFSFALRFLLRILVIAIPFLFVPAVAAFFLLREFDINYYLAARSSELVWAIGIASVFGAALAVTLITSLAAWAVSLHICLFEKATPSSAFAKSERVMKGNRRSLVRSLVLWFLVRAVLASIIASGTGLMLAFVPGLVDGTLTSFYIVTALIVGVWAIANSILTTVSLGALAIILNEQYARHSPLDIKPDQLRLSAGIRAVWIVGAVCVLSFVSLAASGIVSNRFGGVKQVAVIGHRGAALVRPENTMAAVVKAVEDGADWVEIDVQETVDGHVIVVHDSDFMKAAGNPVKVWDVTLDEAMQIDIGSWFDPGYSDERPPLLSDVLKTVNGKSKLLIELKYYGHDEDLENRVISLVEAEDMEDQVATMSLKYPAVQKMKSLRPDWRSGVLAATSVGNLAGLEGDFLAVSAGSLSNHLLAQASVAKKDVYVWTVNDVASMSRMISMGADGIITDDPALANKVIIFYQQLSTPERLMVRLADQFGFAFDLIPDVNSTDGEI